MSELSRMATPRASIATPLFSPPLFPPASPIGWLRGEIDRLFDDFGRPATNLFNFASPVVPPIPAMELVDDDKEYRLSAELPGMTDEDVEIALADGVMTISGEKKEAKERNTDGYLLRERRYGAFIRQIPLPADVQPEAIKAHFANGVLTVTLGKDKKAQERLQKIPIES